jgi:TonB family protein
MRRWLVIPSIAVHVGIIVALLFLGAWHLDKLDAGRTRVDIYSPPPLPAAQEGSPAAKPQTFQRKEQKKEITKALVVPTEKSSDVVADSTPATDGTGTGNGLGSGTGSGEGSGASTDGPCTSDCGPAVVAVVEHHEPKVVAPNVLTGLRISGETQIQPPDTVKTEMHRSGQDRATANYQVCLDASGNVASTKALKSSGFPAYDERLASAIAGWRYRPYSLGGRGIPVCSVVTFIFAMK